MRASQPHSRFGASERSVDDLPRTARDGSTGGDSRRDGANDTCWDAAPGVLVAIESGVTAGERPGTLSADTGRPPAPAQARSRDRLAGAFGLRPLSGALVLALALAGCEADHVGAKDALLEWGYTGIGITTGPMFDRPCRVGQPYAVRFTAHDAAGKPAAGWVCASDEFAHDGLIFLDREAS